MQNKRFCKDCEEFTYASENCFCKHSDLPVIQKDTEWPWLNNPFEIPSWCPKEAKIKESLKKLLSYF